MNRNIAIVVGICIVGMAATGCVSQELKPYKKSPEEVKAMTENYEAKLKAADKVRGDLKMEQDRCDSLQRLYNAASAKLKMAEREVNDAQQEKALAEKGMAKGVIFKVQIGAFKKFNIKADLSDDPSMTALKEAGLEKYMIGKFRTYDEAVQLKKDLRKIGLKDAFIVAFENGQKIDVETAKKKTATPKTSKGASSAPPAK